MQDKKIPFFIRIKKAIFNFDEYYNFALEKTRTAVFYYIILMLIVSLIISIAFTYKAYNTVNVLSSELEEVLPNFKIENNELVLDIDEGMVIENEEYKFAIIMDQEKTEITDITYDGALLILKDKIVLKYLDINQKMTYQELLKSREQNTITKQEVFEYLNSNKMVGIYLFVFAITILNIFVTHVFAIFVYGISILTLLGLLISSIFRVGLKIKAVFNMAFYAMTLSILLYMIYMGINILMGFELKYFNLAYNGISYIYITTAILMIKSDLIKQQMELMKIIEVQGQVRKELEEKKEEENKKEQEKDKKGNTKDNKEKKEVKKKDPKSAPEGSKA